VRAGRLLGVLGIVATAAAAAWLAGACAQDETPKTPPAVVETADSISREVTIDAPVDREESDSSPAIVRLVGHVFGSGKTGVLLAHMRPADQTAWYRFAQTAAATGSFTVMTFDFRGYGSSGGEKEFEHLDVDLAAALAYMKTTLHLDRVFLVGASMGGSASIVVGARELVAGIVSISSPAQFETLDALSAEPDIGVPQLFICSDGDVPARNSLEELVAAATHPVEQQIYDGAAHGTDIFAGPHRAEITQRVLGFLESH
jgi:pimeloyl-ACP methyl ester carboxylesterase